MVEFVFMVLGWFFGWVTAQCQSFNKYTVTIKLQEQDGVWYAFEETTGLTVRAESRKAVIEKMREALSRV